MSTSQNRFSDDIRKQRTRGRLPGDRVDQRIAIEFRALMREGMALYGAEPRDVVVLGDGKAATRSARWVSLQLSPSRRLFKKNARELFWLIENCEKACAFRRANSSGAFDVWSQKMFKLMRGEDLHNDRMRDERFVFLNYPAVAAVPPIFFIARTRVDGVADALADRLAKVEGIGKTNKPRVCAAVKRFLLNEGAAASRAFISDSVSMLHQAMQHETIEVNSRPLDAPSIERTETDLKLIHFLAWRDK